MLAEAGLAALWFAAALALLQLVLAGLGVWRSAKPALAQDVSTAEIMAAVRPVAVVQGVLALAAMLLLIWVFARSDMSVLLVAQNSHSDKPMLYKVAGAWGNHEGSMLLWVTILGVAGAAVALLERSLAKPTLIATLGAQAAIALGFYAFLLFSSNPFARIDPAPVDGNGLNPLLQDPGLAFHPPTLYIGYVGISIAFSFAVGAMITRDVGPAFARAMRPWVLGAWIFLTLGITAGSYWAYYELGWGGWWFWDPVENASLMPWLAATALLHSVTVLATRDGLRAWTLMLAVVAFSMSMLGTFLVRSGILTSVHAFAVDPTRGSFILALLAIYIGGALLLFALRVGTVKQGNTFDFVSREGALIANNLLLTVILGIVLIGTLYPIVAAGFGTQLSVGPPFFDKAAGPVALALVAVMAAGPMLRWRRDTAEAVLQRMIVPVVATAIVLILLVVFGKVAILPLLGLALAAGLAIASVAPLWKRNLRRTPLFTYGMVIAHLGIAVSLAGMACDTAFTQATLVAARVGEPQRVGPFSVTLDGIKPVVGPNWSALEARLSVTRGEGGSVFYLRPQSRFFANPVTTTSESAIATRWDGQLYTVLGEPDGTGRWQLRLWWKPFVTLIWFGGALVAVGGALSLLGRLLRARVRAARALRMKRPLIWLPFLGAIALFAVIAWGLYKPADRTVHSALVGQKLPVFNLPPIVPGKPGLSAATFATGKPRLLNVFASWCIPCIAEAPQLLRLKQAGVEIDAVAIRDTPDAIADFLARNGDPYASIGDDKASSVQLALGSSGVPETFVIDGQGRIVQQHVGDIRADEVPGLIAAVRNAR